MNVPPVAAAVPAYVHHPGASVVLTALREASAAAEHAGDCCWQFAVEVPVLLSASGSVSLLRSLVRAGLAEHRQEISRPADTARRFLPLANLSFPQRTCLVLTDAGMTFARENRPKASPARVAGSGCGPKWSVKTNAKTPLGLPAAKLSFAEQVIKSYRVPAENQELGADGLSRSRLARLPRRSTATQGGAKRQPPAARDDSKTQPNHAAS